MGRNDLKAKIRLEGDSKGANKAIKSVSGRFKKLGETINTGFWTGSFKITTLPDGTRVYS